MGFHKLAVWELMYLKTYTLLVAEPETGIQDPRPRDCVSNRRRAIWLIVTFPTPPHPHSVQRLLFFSNSLTIIRVPASHGQHTVFVSGAARVFGSDPYPGEALVTRPCSLRMVRWSAFPGASHGAWRSARAQTMRTSLLAVADGDCAGWSLFAPPSRPTLMECSGDLPTTPVLFDVAMGGPGRRQEDGGAWWGAMFLFQRPQLLRISSHPPFATRDRER